MSENINNPGQPFQPQQGQPYPPVTPVGSWPVPPQQPVAPVKPKGRNGKVVVGGFVGFLLLVACCGGVVSLAGGGEQPPVKRGAAATAPVQSSPAATSAPTTTEPVEPEPSQSSEEFGLPLGVTFTATDYDGTVEITVSKSKKYPKPRTSACKKYMADPNEGYYLVFDVKVEVIAGTGSINPLYFEFVDGDGYTASTMVGSFSGCGKWLDSGNDLRAGTKRSGQLVFDTASLSGEVTYNPVLGSPVASWKVG